jgi:hypothetical protein
MAEKRKVEADVFSPEVWKVLNLTGNNPAALIQASPKIIREVLRLSGTKLYEDHIKWDITSDPTMFYGIWRGFQDKDSYTRLEAWVVIEGTQSVKEKTGTVQVRLRGILKTGYEFKSPLDPVLFWWYMRRFYAELRRNYMSEALMNMEKIENAIRDQLAVRPTRERTRR